MDSPEPLPDSKAEFEKERVGFAEHSAETSLLIADLRDERVVHW